MKPILIAGPLFLLAAAAGPCQKPENPGHPGTSSLEGSGTVHQGVGPECPSTWAVVTSDGRTLWPVNDPAFQKDGMKVRFTAQARTDMASICMAGTIVEFVTLRQD